MSGNNYSLVGEFESYKHFEDYRKTLFRCGILSTNKRPCTICVNGNHQIRIQYLSCSNRDCFANGKACPKRYKVYTCFKNEDLIGKVQLWELDSHNSEENSNKFYGELISGFVVYGFNYNFMFYISYFLCC